MLSESMESVVEGMEQLDSNGRVRLMEEIGKLHGMTLTLFTLLHSQAHKDHDCELRFPKDIVDGYLEAWHKDVYTSIEITCAANGIDFEPDPNKEVRDEILRESSD